MIFLEKFKGYFKIKLDVFFKKKKTQKIILN